MTLLVRAFPVTSRAAVEQFAGEMRERAEETRQFYSRFGVRRESWFVQEMPSGAYIVGVTDVEDPVPEKAADFANANDTFTQWFQKRVLELSGVDQHEHPLGPETERLYDALGTTASPDEITVRMFPLNDGVAPLRSLVSGLAPAAEAGESCFVQNIGGSPHAITISSRPGGGGILSSRLGVAEVPPTAQVFDFRR